MDKSMASPSFGVKLMLMLPLELLLEIFIRIPGKQLGRCKCVCKSWRLMIGSPPFLEAYRSRQSSLILYWLEDNNPKAIFGTDFRLRFFHYPLPRFQEPTSGFSQLSELRTGRFRDWLTEVVNGLICVCDSDVHLTVYNVCTGQGMGLPDPTHYNLNPVSSFHLGYDPSSKMYKLLRLVHPFSRTYYRSFQQINQTLEAEILTLGPSGSQSTWRKLDTIASGIGDLMEWRGFFGWFENSFSGDGIIWLSGQMSLLSFDLNKEKFRLIKFPEDVSQAIEMNKFDFSDSRLNGYILTQSMGRPALWIKTGHPKSLMLFVLEDEEANVWSKHHVQFPDELGEVDRIAVEAGNLPTGELLLMNGRVEDQGDCRPVFSYNHGTHKFDRFVIGKHPENPDYRVLWSNEKLIDNNLYRGKISCLHDNNNLHRSLDNVLSGRV
ncbi:OLC1v1006066C1 [Oldenlandia corymbosa var. corymbosa]|uniref:OLC1v1006066C1 n=1 Tax=Oldenlandia corymbosa var. corymbosa TaxID=529605 RepID=A0AAV1DGS1_OLDCO|nr:OLC1v1006066C1 [Oldenlandia corymbosa var. corymbosa]